MLHPDLTSWKAQFDRLRRSYDRVTGPYASSVQYQDDLYHFMQDCFHLKDWIKNDPVAGIGTAIESEVNTCKALRIAADLANGAKHLCRNKNREGAYVTSFGVTAHLAQDRPIDVDCVVTLADGTTIPVDVVVREAFNDWNNILAKIRLIP